jgi:hypothetical protein
MLFSTLLASALYKSRPQPFIAGEGKNTSVYDREIREIGLIMVTLTFYDKLV